MSQSAAVVLCCICCCCVVVCSEKTITAFAKGLLDGSVQPEYKSAPIPDEPTDGGVTVIVGKNFDEIVKNKDKDVLLEVSSTARVHVGMHLSHFRSLVRVHVGKHLHLSSIACVHVENYTSHTNCRISVLTTQCTQPVHQCANDQ